MIIHPYSHDITASEIEDIKSLGFEIKGDIISCEDFVNRYFHNCDLLKLLRELNDILIPLCNTKIFKSVTLSNTYPPKIEINIQSEDCGDDERGLALSRVFTWENNELIVKHEFFVLPKSARNKGISKQVYRSCIQQYVNMGIQKIRIFAGLQEGGYIWAKTFFVAAHREEMAFILNVSRTKLTQRQFQAIERIYNNYYTKNPDGNAFPIKKWAELPFMESILKGSQWNGVIDLTNREQFTNFTKYVSG